MENDEGDSEEEVVFSREIFVCFSFFREDGFAEQYVFLCGVEGR